jgi:hypothetical protein
MRFDNPEEEGNVTKPSRRGSYKGCIKNGRQHGQIDQRIKGVVGLLMTNFSWVGMLGRPCGAGML